MARCKLNECWLIVGAPPNWNDAPENAREFPEQRRSSFVQRHLISLRHIFATPRFGAVFPRMLIHLRRTLCTFDRPRPKPSAHPRPDACSRITGPSHEWSGAWPFVGSAPFASAVNPLRSRTVDVT